MCGVVGIVSHDPVKQALYDALIVLQHRGQDAAGIVTCEVAADRNRLHLRKDNGSVKDVFRSRHMLQLQGNMGIGHVRYPTAGSSSSAESQPFYVNSPYGLTLAHNGNLTNTEALAKALFESDLRHINTSSDSEVLLNILAHELQSLKKLVPSPDDVFTAVSGLHKRVEGAYAVVAMLTGYGLLAFRDPFGIRPLIYGVREDAKGNKEYMVASESVALVTQGFKVVRDLEPGEAIYITESGELHAKQCAINPQLSPCLFEIVYLARPDSIVDKISIYKTRLRLGERLAAKVRREWADHDIDVVIPIPDTSRTAALQMAHDLGVKYREGFIKNRYIGRTFIMPGQSERRKSVRQKLNPIDLEFRGKNVLLVDDSVVRGTTCQQIIQMAREAGAKKVYFASAAPPVRYPNVYGIDMPVASELIANHRTVEEVGELIGADKMIYQDLEDLCAAAAEGNPDVTCFEASVFDGKYIAGTIDQQYLAGLQSKRNDATKKCEPSSAHYQESHASSPEEPADAAVTIASIDLPNINF